jgi:hypothetical protein
MFSSEMVQDVQKCFPDLYSPNDPDLILISDYSIFRSGTLELINDLFEELGTYGLISGIPSDVLFVFQKRFESYLNIFPDLRDRLISSVDDITRKLSNTREEVGPGSFIEWLYSKKRRRTLAKISYYDFIRDIEGYVHHFLFSKAN